MYNAEIQYSVKIVDRELKNMLDCCRISEYPIVVMSLTIATVIRDILTEEQKAAVGQVILDSINKDEGCQYYALSCEFAGYQNITPAAEKIPDAR